MRKSPSIIAFSNTDAKRGPSPKQSRMSILEESKTPNVIIQSNRTSYLENRTPKINLTTTLALEKALKT